MSGVIVVKFGGSVLKDLSAIEEAASWVKKLLAGGYKIVVVVSAMKGVTDELVNTAKMLAGNPDPELMDEILSMGERISARLFTLALREHGVNAMFIDPADDYWPIVTDSNHLDAEPLYIETKKNVKEKIVPLLERGVVPVVCGFIGVTVDRKITTLGRGGSDTTAVLIANCLEAEEVVLVKDVPGVFSADPDIVGDSAKILSELDFREAQALVKGGAKIIHTKALRYLDRKLKLRIASMEELAANGGTVIRGYDPEIEVKTSPVRITMVTIIREDLDSTDVLEKIMKLLKKRDVKVLAVTCEEKALILYLEEREGIIVDVHSCLVNERLGKAVSFYQDLAMITVSGRMLETSPGIIHKITKPLAENNINLYGLITISSSIKLIVSSSVLEKARELLVKMLREEVEVVT
ncbi:MAG: aspartate kinase [Nitrososphaerota archaeon]